MKHDACACCGSANISQLEKLLWNRILFKNCVMQNYIFKLDLKSKKLHNFQLFRIESLRTKKETKFFQNNTQNWKMNYFTE